MKRQLSLIIILIFILSGCSSLKQVEKINIDEYIYSGELKKAEKQLIMYLNTQKKDNQVRFELGIIQFLLAIEGLAQTVYMYNPTATGRFLPFLRIPVPENPEPKLITYSGFNDIFTDFSINLAKAYVTFKQVEKSDVKVPIYLSHIQMDINNDSMISDYENLWNIYRFYNRNANELIKNPGELLVVFDYADTFWFRGYCKLLVALCNIFTAYDYEKLFDYIAPYLFKNAYTYYQEEIDEMTLMLITKFKLKHKKNMNLALEYLLEVLSLSRESWSEIMNEADNDHEWIPGPGQNGAIPGIKISKEIVDGWIMFLDEAEKILSGTRLVPVEGFTNIGKGININTIFMKPKDFDLVKLIMGKHNLPIETGELTKPETWNRLNRIFGGEFIGFALWFN